MKKFEEWTKQEKASAVFYGGEDRMELVEAYYNYLARHKAELFNRIVTILTRANAYMIFAECDTIIEMVEKALELIKESDKNEL